MRQGWSADVAAASLEAGIANAAFAPDDVCCVIEPIGDAPRPLFAAERRMLGGGVVARRAAEFAAGRHCARRALRQLGVEPAAILIGEGGAPQWPPGVTGSISHGADLAGAIVSRSGRYSGLGLDIERRGSLTPELHRLLFTEGERSSPIDPDRGALLFSAKEAVYKAAYPLLRRWIDFTDVTILVDIKNARFRACPLTRNGDLTLLESGEGSFVIRGDAVLTLFRLSP